MKNEIPFSDEQLAYMASSYKEGSSLEALAVEFGVSKTVVSRRLEKLGVSRRPVGCPMGSRIAEKFAEAKWLLAQGYGPKKIAAEMNVCLRSVYRYLEK